MYTKQEASKLRQAFWTTFGQYMQPILSADGERVNWINYKTGVKGFSFKMDADERQATIGIVLSQDDTDIQMLYYDQLQQLKTMLEDSIGTSWEWQPLLTDAYGKTISSISAKITNVNINRKEDWPQLISFFKPRIITLDNFWSIAKYGFESLGY